MRKALQAPLIFLLLCLIAQSAQAQRLPSGVHPEGYKIWLNPDLYIGNLQGREIIDLQIEKDTKSIALNAVGLQIDRAEFSSAGKQWKATAETQKDREMVELHFQHVIPAGRGSLAVEFSGHIRDDLRGLYRLKTKRRAYAVTQFEGTYARMMFPCFDEPEYKATYQLDVVVRNGDVALSNAAIKSATPGPGSNEQTIHFLESPKMSTYLVALAIGDFQCLQDSVDGIPIRVCSLPEKKALGAFALKSARFFLHFYNNWYGIHYPFRKLDMVAIPDYEWGGMENTACIFYRESALLMDEKVAAVGTKRHVASILAHEISHQWFGDLVTMKWWDDIWLNEAFATWITHKALQAFDPKWDQTVEEAASSAAIQNRDTLDSTRRIRAKAETPDEIKEMFDGITYSKGAAVLAMLENYVGPSVFRKAVNAYLQAHANQNATAENFWEMVTSVSKKPIHHVMPTFIDQAGIPLLAVKEVCEDGKMKLQLSQKRFFSNTEKMNAQETAAQWLIPFCSRNLRSTESSCRLLDTKQQSFDLENCDRILINAGARGYYISQYEPEVLAEISRAAQEKLKPAELMQLIHDQWLLVVTGQINIGDFFALVSELKSNRNRAVIELLLSIMDEVERKMAAKDLRTPYHQWMRNWLTPLSAKIGFEARANDSDELKQLRADLLHALGIAEDKDAIQTSREIVRKYIKDPESVDGSLADAAIEVAAKHGDTKFFDEVLAQLDRDLSPEAHRRYVYSLAAFTEPALTQRAIDYAMSAKMNSDDIPGFFATLLQGPNFDLTWKYLQAHWSELQVKAISFGGAGAVSGLGEACDVPAEKQIRDFFQKHTAPAAELGVKRALETIHNCVQLRRLQDSNFKAWLQNAE